jgi:hypothetical protein
VQRADQGASEGNDVGVFEPMLGRDIFVVEVRGDVEDAGMPGSQVQLATQLEIQLPENVAVTFVGRLKLKAGAKQFDGSLADPSETAMISSRLCSRS